MQQEPMQQPEFSIIEWLAEDQPPCEGGRGWYICSEYCGNTDCPYFLQYQAEAVEAEGAA